MFRKYTHWAEVPPFHSRSLSLATFHFAHSIILLMSAGISFVMFLTRCIDHLRSSEQRPKQTVKGRRSMFAILTTAVI